MLKLNSANTSLVVSILLAGVLVLIAAIPTASAEGRGWHTKKNNSYYITKGGHRGPHHSRKYQRHNKPAHWKYRRPAHYYRVIEPSHRHVRGYSNHTHGWRANRHHHNTQKSVRRSGFEFNQVMGGQIIGAILGGAAGTQFGKGNGRTVAIAGGAILGAIIGGEVGKTMQAADQQQANRVLEATPTGQTITWNNPDTGRGYQMTPTKTYKTESNVYCREYTSKARIGGSQNRVYGQACRMPDGSWKILN